MKLLHFTNSKFDKFDPKRLGESTIDRQDDYDACMDISNFGFCFVAPKDAKALLNTYGDDFGKYIAVCEFNADKNNNFESAYDDFVEWIERDGVDAVKAELRYEGAEFIYLWNGEFSEIVPLDLEKVEIKEWKENK